MSNKEQRQGEARHGGIRTIRLLVAANRYDWTQEVQAAIEDGLCEPEDLESCIETGRVTKTNRDRYGESLGNKVYTIVGRDRAGCEFYTAGKILKADDGALYFFVTAHRSWRG